MFKLQVFSTLLAVTIILISIKFSDTGRVKRYLAFPKGSSFIASVALTTFLPKDTIPTKAKTGFSHIVEYDFGYPIPDKITYDPEPPKKKRKKVNAGVFVKVPPWAPEYYVNFPSRRRWTSKRKGRLLEQLSSAIDRHGFSGESCVVRLACEIEENLQWGRSLIEDILLVTVPRFPSQEVCRTTVQKCPFSILHAFMHSTFLGNEI